MSNPAAGKRILVIEPSTYMGRALQQRLEESGFTVALEKDPASLVAYVKKFKPHLVITDIALPATFQHIQALRSDEFAKFLPVFLHVLKPSRSVILKAREVGATDILLKPVSFDTLAVKISKALGIEVELKAGPVKKAVAKAAGSESKLATLLQSQADLRALPNVVMKALQIAQSQEASASDVAKVVNSDTAMAGSFLKLANSATYASARTISDVQEAIARVGFENSKKILIGLSVVKLFDAANRSINFTRKGFWEHSLACGILASEIAKFKGTCHPTLAFTAGLLHDIGKIIFDDLLSEDFEQAVEIADHAHKPMRLAELDVLGFNHNQVGYAFLKHWQLPDALCHVAFHHNRDSMNGLTFDASVLDLIKIVWFSNLLAKAAGFSGAGDTNLGPEPVNLAPELGIPPDALDPMLATLDREMEDFKAYINFEQEPQRDTRIKRGRRHLYYYSPIDQQIDVVELFLCRSGYLVQKFSDFKQVLPLVQKDSSKTLLVAQLHEAAFSLGITNEQVMALPLELPVVCLGTPNEIRLMRSRGFEFTAFHWPLAADSLAARLDEIIEKSWTDF